MPSIPNNRRAKKIWDKIFPLKEGDRVRVKKGFLKQPEYSLAYGKTGVIEKIMKGPTYPLVVKFDKREIQEKVSHVFKRDELEFLGHEKDDGET